MRLYRLKPEKRYLDFADYIVENGGAEGFDLFQAAFEDTRAISFIQVTVTQVSSISPS